MENESTESHEGFSDKLEDELADRTAATVFQLVWGFVKTLGNKAATEVAVRDASRKYAERYRQRYGTMKVLGMREPINIQTIFTAVNVVNPCYLNAFTLIDDLERQFRGTRRHTAFSGDGARSATVVANEQQFLNILGAPGSGKTTFLRRLGYEALFVRTNDSGDGCETTYSHQKLPVLVEFRALPRSGDVNILRAITQEFETCGFPASSRFVNAALRKGRLLILLDGLDEVPEKRLTDTIRAVSSLVDKHGKHSDGNRFVTSCRTAHYKNYFKHFTDVVVADFNDDQIKHFAERWFKAYIGHETDLARDFMSELQASENIGAMELARTPLLLTFLCLTFQTDHALPPTLSTLYERALDILLREWAVERRVHLPPVVDGIHAKLEIDMLAKLAFDLFSQNQYFFSKGHIIEAIGRFLGGIRDLKHLDPEDVLNAIEVQQGLIVQRAKDAYSFSHLTIQEYLTARYARESGIWSDLIEERMRQKRWAIVFVLMAGLSNADSLLSAMAEASLRTVFHAGDHHEILEWLSGRYPSSIINRLLLFAFLLDIIDARNQRFDDDGVPEIDDVMNDWDTDANDETEILELWDEMFDVDSALVGRDSVSVESDGEEVDLDVRPTYFAEGRRLIYLASRLCDEDESSEIMRVHNKSSDPLIRARELASLLSKSREQPESDEPFHALLAKFGRGEVSIGRFILKSGLRDLDTDEIQILLDHCFDLELIDTCADAAYLVSEDVWAEIVEATLHE